MQPFPPLEPIFSEFNKATEHELRAIEAVLDATLPVQVATFLRSYGGASFLGDATVTAIDETPCPVFTMFRASGPKGSVTNDLVAHPDYVSDGLLPVADDLFNNRYVVDLCTGVVRFLDYGEGHRLEREIAGSFDAFLAAIRVTPD